MRRLRDQGHATVSIGKLHFRSGNDDNGFSEEILPMYLANDGKGWPQGLIRNPMPDFEGVKEMARDAGPGESTYTEYDRRIAAEASNWLRRYPTAVGSKPWALFVSFVSPHYPLTAPQEFYDLYADQQMPPTIAGGHNQKPNHPVLQEMAKFWDYDSHFDNETRERAKRGYLGLCSFLDDNIRQVLEALEDSGAARDTVVIYITDHGEMLGNHGYWAKSVMYEDSVGIPLIMSGANVPIGVNHTPVSLTDIAATVENTVELDRPKAEAPWQSRPLQDFIAAPEAERFILSEYHDGGSPTGFFMIRQGAWKYVYYAGGQPCQLFNMEMDPDELTDLGESPDHKSIRDLMYRHLTSILDPEEINAQAFADQAVLLEQFGGRESVLAMPSFNHTPVGS
jgi:choline-sulfatase